MNDGMTPQQVFLYMQSQLIRNMKKACLVVESDAKRNCPVDNGQLRASIISETVVKGNAVKGYIGSNMDYAPYVHQGTGIYAVNGDGRPTPWRYKDPVSGKWFYTEGQEANPFLKNAIDGKRDLIEVMLSEGLT